MATFVHLTPEKHTRRILRSGIKAAETAHGFRGVFAMPVLPNFYLSHQWLRELKRQGQRTLCGVYFRLPDAEPVWIGHYNKPHVSMTAAEAIALLLKANTAEGFEVIIPRNIEAHEIQRVRHLPRTLGWRYYPGAHGHRPCTCPICLGRGEIKSRRLRAKYE